MINGPYQVSHENEYIVNLHHQRCSQVIGSVLFKHIISLFFYFNLRTTARQNLACVLDTDGSAQHGVTHVLKTNLSAALFSHGADACILVKNCVSIRVNIRVNICVNF